MFLHDGVGRERPVSRVSETDCSHPFIHTHGHGEGSQQCAGPHSVDGVTREEGAASEAGRGSLGSSRNHSTSEVDSDSLSSPH